MTTMRPWQLVVVALSSVACNNSAGSPGSQEAGFAGGSSVYRGGTNGTTRQDPLATQYVGKFASSTPQEIAASSAGSGAGGDGARALIPPFGVSTTCGDAIVGSSEECDDGVGTGADACTPQCQTRDQPAATTLTKIDRLQGTGRHPLAGLDGGFISSYVEFPDNEDAAIGATLFNVWGQSLQQHVNVSAGASPIDDANPVTAALPSGDYAVAWSDFDGDGSDLGVALRKVSSDGRLGSLLTANEGREFSQLNPDMLWTGTQLVVAWEDYADAVNGPDLRYRLFDAELNPLSDDIALADSALPEAAVALAPFDGSWAAAYREGAVDGKENVVVRVGEKSFRTGPVRGGPIDDRPALVALDATHLLVVFSEGTDPSLTGVYNVARLRYALIDTAGSTTPASFSLDPLDDLLTLDTQVSHLSPAAELGADGVYIAWRSEGRPGDAAGDQIWLKYLSWDPTRAPALETREAEMLIPRTCEGSFGDQRTPALARVNLPPIGALAIAWDDYSHSQGAEAGDPDVVVQYAPTHLRGAADAHVFSESWRAANGSPWSSHWSTELSSPSAFTVDVQNNEGRILSSAVANGIAYVNDHTALNVEMVSKVRFNFNAASAGLIARRADTDSDSYLGARFGTATTDKLRVYAMIDNVATDLQVANLPYVFSAYAQGLDHYLKFRAVTNADQSITLSAKFWLADLPEPATWGVTGTVPATPPVGSALANIKDRLATRGGRFGVYAAAGVVGRSATFDDFRASFFEGSVLADPPTEVSTELPLKRAQPLYPTCTGEGPCCCNSTSECPSGSSCTGALSEFLGVGSDAKTCTSSHCTNKIMDADETHADCGGADCAPCSTCTSSALPGASGYCSASCPCGAGGTDCNNNSQCLPGLVCVLEHGYRYGYAQGSDSCVPQHCLDRVQDADELGPDWGGSCGSIQCFPSGNGGYAHCNVSCPCPRGEGDCDYNDECASGLACGSGTPFGIAFNVCVAPHCGNKIKDTALGETGVDCGGPDCGPICP